MGQQLPSDQDAFSNAALLQMAHCSRNITPRNSIPTSNSHRVATGDSHSRGRQPAGCCPPSSGPQLRGELAHAFARAPARQHTHTHAGGCTGQRGVASQPRDVARHDRVRHTQHGAAVCCACTGHNTTNEMRCMIIAESFERCNFEPFFKQSSLDEKFATQCRALITNELMSAEGTTNHGDPAVLSSLTTWTPSPSSSPITYESGSGVDGPTTNSAVKKTETDT